MRFSLAIAVLTFLVILLHTTADAQTVVVKTGKSAILGSAYDGDKEDFISQQCVKGTEVPTGTMQSSIHLEQSMVQEELERSLGFSVGARARYGVVDISGSAKFLSEAASTSYSVSSIYSAMYEFQTRKLVDVTKNSLGTGLAPNFDRWQTTCGDSFVDEIHSGARLFFSIRIDFSSQSEKQQFEANFSVSGPMAGIEGTLQQASKQFSGNTKVTVSAYQVGGDVSKVSAIFGDKDKATEAYIQCTLGHFDECATVLANALVYATNTATGFPSQIAAHPAVTSYGVSTYEKAGIYTRPYPGLSDMVRVSRDELSKQFEGTFASYLAASRLAAVTPIAFQKPKLQGLKDTLWGNLTQLGKASEVCYETPNSCPEAVHQNLHLKEADLGLLLPPTFGEICKEAFKLPGGSPLRNSVETIVFLEGLDIVRNGSEDEADPRFPRDCNGMLFADQIDRLDITPEAIQKARTEVAPNFHHLFHPQDPVSDLTPLISMPQLVFLSIESQVVSDLSPLSTLSKVDLLMLNVNHVTDLRPLSGMISLTILSVGSNDIQDIAALGNLRHLKILDISKNQIVDITPLSKLKQLTSLYAKFDQISDIKPISDLPELTDATFEHNTVKTLDGFQSALRLKNLDLSDNFIPTDSIQKFCAAFKIEQLLYTDMDDGRLRYCRSVPPPATKP